MRNIFVVIVFILGISCSDKNNIDKSIINILEVNKWDDIFKKSECNGTFALTKYRSDTISIFNKKRANNEYIPASTYKILNSLIALEEKVIKDENEIIKWDGKIRSYDKWNQDHNLKSAIKVSCVWFYQELAKRIGNNKMQDYLRKTDYGNSKMGASIDDFWLEGDLRISVLEQIEFLNKFLSKELLFSDSNYQIVKDIMRVESGNNYFLHAKTGWGGSNENNQIGWYVGFVEKETETWLFALNIDIKKEQDAKQRIEITRKILFKEGIIN